MNIKTKTYLQNFDLRAIFTGNTNVMRLYGADIRAQECTTQFLKGRHV